VQVIKPRFSAVKNEILGVQCIFWDVTSAQTRGGSAFARARSGFVSCSNRRPSPTMGFDREGVVTRVNQAECALLGYEPWEMVGRRIWDLRPWKSRRPATTLSGENRRRTALGCLLRGITFVVTEPASFSRIHENLIRDPRGGSRRGSAPPFWTSRSVSGPRKPWRGRPRSWLAPMSSWNQFAYVASQRTCRNRLRKIQTFRRSVETEVRRGAHRSGARLPDANAERRGPDANPDQ